MVDGSCVGGLSQKLNQAQLEETAAVAKEAWKINTTGFATTRGTPGRPVGRSRRHAVTAYGARRRSGAKDQSATGWGTYSRRPNADPELVARYDKAMAAACAAMAAVDAPRDHAGYERMRRDLARVGGRHPRFVPACSSHEGCIVGENASNAVHVDKGDAKGCFSLVGSVGRDALGFALPAFGVVVEILPGSVLALDTVKCDPP